MNGIVSRDVDLSCYVYDCIRDTVHNKDCYHSEYQLVDNLLISSDIDDYELKVLRFLFSCGILDVPTFKDSLWDCIGSLNFKRCRAYVVRILSRYFDMGFVCFVACVSRSTFYRYVSG